jgi:hypothetical protein
VDIATSNLTVKAGNAISRRKKGARAGRSGLLKRNVAFVTKLNFEGRLFVTLIRPRFGR